MKRFICSWDVHIRRTTSYAASLFRFISVNSVTLETKAFVFLTRFRVANHFNAAAVAGHQRRLVSRQRRVVEGVLAPRVRPRVAFVAVNGTSCGKLRVAN